MILELIDYRSKWSELVELLPKCETCCERIATTEWWTKENSDGVSHERVSCDVCLVKFERANEAVRQALPWAAHVREFEALEPST